MSFTEDIQELILNEVNDLVSIHRNWERIEVGEVSRIINGFPFDSAKFNSKNGIPLIRIRDITRSRTDTMYDGDIPDGYWVNRNDILIGMDGDFNCARWYGDSALLNQRVCKIEVDVELYSNSFFFNVIHGYLKLINENTPSVTVKHLSSKTLGNTPIPLPPLAEQIRIADKLDVLLSRVDAGRERLERVPKLVKRFRQSVLSAAVSGELTREWRGGGDTEWEEVSTIKLCLNNRALTYGVIKLGEETKDGVPCLRTSNVRRLRYDLEGIKSISKELSTSYSRTILEGNEVLVNVRGSLDGVAVVPANFKGWNVSREVAVVPYDNSKILSNYAAMYIASEVAQSWLRDSYRGVAYTGINIEDLKNLPVPLPSLPEQAEIVRRVEALFALAGRLEARAEAALARYSRLIPALLAKAFRGELVPQDPTDEPASVLLERIRAQREAAGPVKKVPGRGRKPGATTPKAEAGAQAGEAQSEPKRGRGRPRKVQEVARQISRGIPVAASAEEAIRLLEERARAEREGKVAVQAGLFGD